MVPTEYSVARGKMKSKISYETPFKAVLTSVNVGPKLQILCIGPQSSFTHRANRRWFFYCDVIDGLVDLSS
jgi:hypothetical protein